MIPRREQGFGTPQAQHDQLDVLGEFGPATSDEQPQDG